MSDPACWSWPVTADDLAAAQACPENSAHVLLWNWQRGRCAFCGLSRRYIRIVRDHDHSTGLLRGLLCATCNSLEGHAGQLVDTAHGPAWREREAQLVRAMTMYREVNPASRLHLRVQHAATVAPRGMPLPREYVGPLAIVATK